MKHSKVTKEYLVLIDMTIKMTKIKKQYPMYNLFINYISLYNSMSYSQYWLIIQENVLEIYE